MAVFEKISRLFGTDGVRGKPPRYPLDKKTLNHLGYWAGKILLKHYAQRFPTVLLGSDTRSTAHFLKQEFSRGLRGLPGLKIIDAGIIPTAAVSYLVKEKKFLFGVVISASHNPAEENGIKLISPNGQKLPEKIEREIEKNIGRPVPELQFCEPPVFAGKNFASQYRDFLLSTVERDIGWEKLSLILDAANGAAFQLGREIFQNLGVNLSVVNDKPDGKNINKNCGALCPENLSTRCRRRKSYGLTLDGDADRAIILDEQGKIYDGDYLLYLAANYLKKHRQLVKNTVVTTIMANGGFLAAMKKAKIRVWTTAVGDRWVAEGLKKTGAILGGEQSGHIIFRRFLPTGDGLLTALQIFQIILKEKSSLAWLTRKMKKYPQKIFNIRVKKKIPIEEIPVLKKEIARIEKSLKDRGRLVVRYSGTENLLRIMVEAKNVAMLDEIGRRLAVIAERELNI